MYWRGKRELNNVLLIGMQHAALLFQPDLQMGGEALKKPESGKLRCEGERERERERHLVTRKGGWRKGPDLCAEKTAVQCLSWDLLLLLCPHTNDKYRAGQKSWPFPHNATLLFLESVGFLATFKHNILNNRPQDSLWSQIWTILNGDMTNYE